jgi:hypothetical protein
MTKDSLATRFDRKFCRTGTKIMLNAYSEEVGILQRAGILRFIEKEIKAVKKQAKKESLNSRKS